MAARMGQDSEIFETVMVYFCFLKIKNEERKSLQKCALA